MPKFVVLDEPNSNLDTDGDTALIHTLQQLKAAGTTVIIMRHRMNILQVVRFMLVLIDGQIKQFGPKEQVLVALKSEQAPKPQASPKPQPQQSGSISLNPAPVREAIRHGETGCLVDFFDAEALARGVSVLPGDPEKRRALGNRARQFVQRHYDLRRICLPGQIEWVEGLSVR
ncbi:MAG: hypothetical protein ACP5R6_00600 [Chlorobaculum sp.]